MSFSTEPLATYRTSRWQRWGALLAAGGALLVFGIQVAGPRPFFSWPTLLQQIPTGGAMIAAAAYGLQARMEVFETGLREVRPLWWDRTIRFENVQRALLPLTKDGLMLFTGRGGQKQFSVDGQTFERSDQLILQVLRHLPEDAEIEDPAGRIDDLRDDDQ
jgi:hypothetical protein